MTVQYVKIKTKNTQIALHPIAKLSDITALVSEAATNGVLIFRVFRRKPTKDLYYSMKPQKRNRPILFNAFCAVNEFNTECGEDCDSYVCIGRNGNRKQQMWLTAC